MEMFTKEEKEKVEKVFENHDKLYNDFTITFSDNERNFTVDQMYKYVKVNFDVLSKLAEIFNTKDIDTDQNASSGCETCDYGSSYKVTFLIR